MLLLAALLSLGPSELAGVGPGPDPDPERTAFVWRRKRIQSGGMFTLGGWALVNIGTGVAGWVSTDGATRHFHQMNAAWNSINLGLAIGGLVGNHFLDPYTGSRAEVLRGGHKSARIFAINLALDMTYVAGGAALHSLGESRDSDLLLGFGYSVMLQGAFLAVFDGVMLGIEERNNRGFAPLVTSDGTGATLGLSGRF